jgi:hypothetical protein
MEPGEPQNGEENPQEEMLYSSIYNVVGGTEEDRRIAVEDFILTFHSHKGKSFTEKGEKYDLSEFEREKTPEETELVQKLLDKLAGFFSEAGINPLKITPDHIHFLDLEKLKSKNLPPVHFCEPNDQYIGVVGTESKLATAQAIVHEAVHFNTFHSAEITKNRTVQMRRTGASMRIRGEREFYFHDINEVVTTEIEKLFERENFDSIPEIQEEWQKRQEFVRGMKQTYPEKADLADDVAHVAVNPATGQLDGVRYGYFTERDAFEELLENMYARNPEMSKENEDIFMLFVDATLRGELLPLARLVEKTYGKGSFRQLGYNTRSKNT